MSVNETNTNMMGVILHICTSPKKGETKQSVEKAQLIANSGIEGDAHAGKGHRQISLLDNSDINDMREKGLELKPGAFGENIVIEGINLGSVGIGSVLEIGDAKLDITQIGKVCHNRCAIYDKTGDCIMPRTGVFARVVEGGEISPGMSFKVASLVSRDTTQVGVITVSDTCSEGTKRDTAGPAVSELIGDQLHAHIGWAGIVPDEENQISRTIRGLAGRGLHMIITVGGTGCAPRDVTPEATKAVIDREVPGLAETMRAGSIKITPHAMLQRGICGIIGSTLVINLPGSVKAAGENLKFILPTLGHALKMLRGETAHHETSSRNIKQ